MAGWPSLVVSLKVDRSKRCVCCICDDWLAHGSDYSSLKFSHGDADSVIAMNDAAIAMSAFRPEDDLTVDGEILTVMDVARFLRVSKSTVYKLARVGELPASKIGKHWRFLRRDIHQWVRSRSRQT